VLPYLPKRRVGAPPAHLRIGR